jgi:ankyrin repeat protein
MQRFSSLPFDAPIDAYDAVAATLLAALVAGDDDAAWRFKWEHPRFRELGVEAVRGATLSHDDARLVVARSYGFEDWPYLATFADLVREDDDVATFERAVETIVDGDLASLQRLLAEHPSLIRARSMRRHRATLLHYIAANGVEGMRQRTPANIVDIARALLDAGAEPDALADMYDSSCTTMSMLVSSAHPAQAGVQGVLAELLIDRGSAFVGRGTNWQSSLKTALAFGYTETADVLVRRGAPVDDIVTAAGLGRLEDTRRMYPASDADARHAALALAAQLGRTDVVRFLLSSGEDPDRFNPAGFHAHSTPLHQAAFAGHLDTVRALVAGGARRDQRDTLYHGTPLDWAHHGGRTAVSEYLAALD